MEATKNRENIPIRAVKNAKIKTNSMNFSIEIGLPSPRTSSGITDCQFLPVFNRTVPKLKRSASLVRRKPRTMLNKTVEVKKNEGKMRNVRPFTLLSHLSPIESVKNFFFTEQLGNLK